MATLDAPDSQNDCFDELDKVVLRRLAMDQAVDVELEVRVVLSMPPSKLVLALLRLFADLVVAPLSLFELSSSRRLSCHEKYCVTAATTTVAAIAESAIQSVGVICVLYREARKTSSPTAPKFV
jgi:hypothetical protein